MMHNDELPLTPSERARFDALPHEASPAAVVEDRVVQALRVEGAFTRRRPIQRMISLPLAAAAGLLLFLAGALTGTALASRPVADRSAAVTPPTPPTRTIAAPAQGRLVGWL